MWNGGFSPEILGPAGRSRVGAQRPDRSGRRAGGNGRGSGSTAATARRPPGPASPDAPIAGLGFLEDSRSTRTSPSGCVHRAGGRNAVFNFPDGIHSWGYWDEQLQQMKPDPTGARRHVCRTTLVGGARAHCFGGDPGAAQRGP